MSMQKIPNTLSRVMKLLAGFFLLVFGVYTVMSWYILNVTITPRRITHTITPDQLGFTQAESLTFESLDDGTLLQGWLVPARGRQAVILLHGIHAQAWDGTLVDLVEEYTHAGIDVLLFDLRGHGRSSGKYVGLGLRERGDVHAAVNELLRRGYQSGSIGIHGLSYGAAVALLAAPGIKEIGAVIADSAFADIRDVIVGEIQRETGLSPAIAKRLLPAINALARLLYDTDINNSSPEQVIARISPRPVLLIHGTKDTIIPFEQAQRLQAASRSNVELWPLVGYGHTEGIRLEPGYPDWSPMRKDYRSRVRSFFTATL